MVDGNEAGEGEGDEGPGDEVGARGVVDEVDEEDDEDDDDDVITESSGTDCSVSL